MKSVKKLLYLRARIKPVFLLRMKPLTIPNHFVVAATKGAMRQGLPIEFILKGTGIPPELLNRPMARVNPEQFVALIQRLWHILEDELMGFGPVKSKPGTFATMCQYAIHSPNLEVMLKRSAKFYSLFNLAPVLTLETDENTARIVIEHNYLPNDEDHFMQESLLVIWLRTAAWMANQRINLIRVSFNYPAPAHAGEYKSIFNCPVEFERPRTAVEFSTKVLQYPIVQNERTLKQFLKTSPADLLARPSRDESYTGRVRHLIGHEIKGEMPSFEEVATSLHMTPQTLRRRLKEEKTSYQEIKDHIRRDIAIYHLSRPDLSINDIALRVGFTESSTFHRAFKKWTGVTPLSYREKLEQGQ